jgi:hypothetical protein
MKVCIEKFIDLIVREENTPFTIIKYLFTSVGIGMFVAVFFIYTSTSSFIAEASRAEGTVINNINRPIIHFIDRDGKKSQVYLITQY